MKQDAKQLKRPHRFYLLGKFMWLCCHVRMQTSVTSMVTTEKSWSKCGTLALGFLMVWYRLFRYVNESVNTYHPRNP